MKFETRALLLTTCAFAVTSGQAGAQSVQDAPPAPQTSPPVEVDIGEIVVTATRRAESLQDVPLSITAFGQEGLDERGVKDVGDLGRISPGVNFRSSGNLASSISIRGIDSSVGAGTTGVYIDDTPMQVRNLGAGGTASNTYPTVFDLDRVEVLRGPQGTLFGAGSEGGAVRFITPAPGLARYSGYGRAELAFTQYGAPSYEAGAAVGGPIIQDMIGFRVSGFYRRDGGYVDRFNSNTGAVVDKNADNVKTLAIRGALRIEPAPGLSFTPAIYYQRVHRDDTSSYWRNGSDPKNGVFRNGQPISQPGTDKFTLYSLAAQYDIGGVSIVSNTSYFDRRQPIVIDYSGYLAELLGADPAIPIALGVNSPVDFLDAQKIFTQEVRLQSTGSGRLSWVIGGFYQKAKQQAVEFVRSPDLDVLTNALYGAPATAIFGIGLDQPGNVAYSGIDNAQDSQIAGFGQADFEIWTGFKLTAGVRVSQNKFQFSNIQGGPFNGGTTSSSGRQSETAITPKVGVTYEPSSDLLLYASAAKGYRPGGANTAVSATRCAADLGQLGLTAAPSSFDSDSVWSYEAGAKGQIFDRKLTFETSAFLVKWKNIQNSVALPNCGFRFIANLGEAESKGFDVRLVAKPAMGLTLEGTVAYTDARYTKEVLGTVNASGTRSVLTAKGQPLATPPWQVNLAARYEQTIAGDWEGYVRGDYNYASSYKLALPGTFSFDPVDPAREATHFASLRVGVSNKGLDVSIFADNLFNSTDRLSVVHATLNSPLVREATFRPRTVGLTASLRY